MQITGQLVEIGTLEGEHGAIGIDVEAADGQIITVKGLTEDQARSLAPNFMGDITISFLLEPL